MGVGEREIVNIRYDQGTATAARTLVSELPQEFAAGHHLESPGPIRTQTSL